MVRMIQLSIAAVLLAAACCQAQMALKKSQNENIPVINKEFLIYRGTKADAQIQESREEHKDSEIPAQSTESKIHLNEHEVSAVQLGLCITTSILNGSANCNLTQHATH